jgi:hypothetical protein
MESKQITNEGLETLAKFKTAQEIKGTLRTALEDVIKFSNAESKPIMGVVNATDKNLKPIKNLNELLFAVKKGLTPESLGQFYKGILKASKTDQKLLELAAKEVVANPVFKDYRLMSETQMRKALKAKGYSDLGIDAIIAESKTSKVVKDAKTINRLEKKMKKLQNGETKTLTPKSGTPPTPPKNFTATLKEALLKGIASGWTWKKALIWGAGVGLTAAAIWWFLYNSNVPLPNDIPTVEPAPSEDWGPCLNDLIKSSQGKIAVTPNGATVVYVKSTEKYPGGLQFYSNKRVLNVKTGEMGTWSCNGTKSSINEIVSKILREKLLNEQLDQSVMSKYFDSIINELDGWVGSSNLKNVYDILVALRGKTFEGESAIKYLSDRYAESEDGTLLGDVQGVGVKTLDLSGIQYKKKILSILSNSSTSVNDTPTKSSVTINEQQTLDIVWDSKKKTGEVTPIKTGDDTLTKKKKSSYKDCEGQDFPLAYGCKSSKIAEVQKCLGVAADGKLGPNTMKALTDDKYDTSRGLSKDVYDAVKGNCNPVERKKLDTSIEPLPMKGLKMSNLAPGSMKLPDLSKMIQMNQPPIDFYNVLKDAGYMRGDANETTLEDGTVLPATNRVKYKGPDLDDEILGKLDGILANKGYERIKQKSKDYGEKYVWLQK